MRWFRGRRPVGLLVAAVSVCLIAIALAAVLKSRSDSQPSAANGNQQGPAASPTIDPRLILRPKALPVRAKLGANYVLAGTLYPSLPGMNSLTLHVIGTPSGVAVADPPRLSITMPGMRMQAIKAVLTRHDDLFVGNIHLPMFGYYRAIVDIAIDGTRLTGTMQLAVPL